MGAVGFIAGLWADKFDNMATVTNFIIVPLSFLSGTFYSINRLPEPFYTISLWNPFYYIIDGFRAAFFQSVDSNLVYGITYLSMLNLIMYIICYKILNKGWMLKS